MPVAVRLIGGLGNQMFQYAAARRLAARHRTEVLLDLSWFTLDRAGGAEPRPFELDIFVLEARTGLVHGWRTAESRPSGARPVVGGALGRFVPVTQSTPRRFALAPRNCLLVDSYWQSERYFAPVADILRREFAFRHPPSGVNAEVLAKIDRQHDSVSVHVRRGDYATHAPTTRFHGLCSPEYYHAAVNHLAAGRRDPHLYVFSDDPRWCRENLRFAHPTTYVAHNSGPTSFEDLRLMSHCRHHVIANSSFSWWGAWLNPRPDKRVVAPLHWYADPANRPPDITPSSWIRLPNT